MVIPVAEKLVSFLNGAEKEQEQPDSFFPYLSPLPHSKERLKTAWHESYHEWWRKRYKDLIKFDRRMRHISSGEVTTPTLEAILSYPFESFAENISRFGVKLNFYQLSLTLSHPLLSREKVGDTDDGKIIATLVKSQIDLGVFSEEIGNAEALARRVIEKRKPFYLPQI